jgi:hypothetical protein
MIELLYIFLIMCEICNNHCAEKYRNGLCVDCNALLCYVYEKYEENETFSILKKAYNYLTIPVVTAFPIAVDGKKMCSKCRRVYKATTEFFFKRTGSKDGLDSWCKECKSNYDKDHHRFKTYGLDPDTFYAMLDAQNNICLVCKKSFGSERPPTVHHDHTTDKILDLLCNCCNPLLGFAYDDPEILLNAYHYVINRQKRC